jgi:hypothetical protein
MESIFSIIGGFLLVVASVCLAYLARQLQLSRIAETSIREQLNAKSSELTSFLSACGLFYQDNITHKYELVLNLLVLFGLMFRSEIE